MAPPRLLTRVASSRCCPDNVLVKLSKLLICNGFASVEKALEISGDLHITCTRTLRVAFLYENKKDNFNITTEYE
jgi:hypothetical protein